MRVKVQWDQVDRIWEDLDFPGTTWKRVYNQSDDLECTVCGEDIPIDKSYYRR